MRPGRPIGASVLFASASLGVVMACSSFNASSEPSAPDAEVEVEAEVEAEASIPAEAAPKCPDSLIDKFERDAGFAAPWSERVVFDGGKIDIDPMTGDYGKFVTSFLPGSAAVQGERSATLVRHEGTIPKKVTCTFWLRLDVALAASGSNIDIFRVQLEGPDQTRASVRVAANGGMLSIRDDYSDTNGCCAGCCPKSQTKAQNQLQTGGWYKLNFIVDLKGASITEGGIPIVEHMFSPPPWAPLLTTNGTLHISVGVSNAGLSSGKASYDELRCDFEC